MKLIQSKTKSQTFPSAHLCFGGIFDFDAKVERLEEVNAELEQPDVWNDPEKAQALGKERVSLEQVVDTIKNLEQGLEDVEGLLELAVEAEDEETFNEAVAELDELEQQLAKLEFRRMFSGEHDACDCYVDLQAGSGGTEAQDWTEMLLRMYLRWAESKGFKTELMEVSDGDVAGLKSATIRVSGEYAFGWLRTETGIHRLVRKSPFDSNNRRHTSFAAAFVYPEIDDNIDIEINPADLRIDVYRASGAGGQHVNKTDSAVRITHLPTGVVVECQDERSQHKNKAKAMALLASRLENAKRQAQADATSEMRRDLVGSGDRSERIRTYNYPQGRMTDHRINLTLYKLDAIMEGDLTELLDSLHREYQADQLAMLAQENGG